MTLGASGDGPMTPPSSGEARARADDILACWHPWNSEAKRIVRDKIALALDAARRDGACETWEAAAALADDWPAECLEDYEQNCGPGIAQEFRARAAALGKEGTG